MGKNFTSETAHLATAAIIAGTVALGNVFTGNFSTTGNGERVERVADSMSPAWMDDHGTRLEICGTFRQTATGEASVLIRMFDATRPVALAWQGATGFHVARPGGLPQNVPASSSNAQTVAWRLRVHGLHNSTQRLVLETQLSNGAWQEELRTEAAVYGLREWVEAGGILTVGLAGPVEWESDTTVRVVRDASLMILK